MKTMPELKPKYFLYARKSTEDDDHQIMSIEAQLFELHEYARREIWFEPTPQGKFMLQVAFGQSKYYSDNLVENINRGIRQKVRRGEWLTKAPFGYLNNPKTRNIEPHATESRIVVRAFEEYAKGTHTLGTIADFMADHGIVTRNGTPPAKASVARMFTNRVYLGLTHHKGEHYDGSFAPIVSPILFEAVQKILAKKSRPRVQKVPNHFPFAQFARCGECGSMITAQYATNRFGTTYTYYRCTKKKGVCGQPYVSSSALTAQMKSLLQTVSLPLSEIEVMEKQIDLWEKESISESGSVAQNLKTKLSETKEKLDKLVSIYLDGDIEREIYLARKDLLLRQKAKLEESFKDFGQQRKNWVEPLRRFVLSLREAVELEKGENYFAWRTYFQSIGSNPTLKDKSLSIHWGELFEFMAHTKANFILESVPRACPTARPVTFSDGVSIGGLTGSRTPDSAMRMPRNTTLL